MEIVCLDLEGVLVPEIWIAFAEETGIPELKRTTRDEPDYDKLMKYRLNILKEHGLGLKEIQETIAQTAVDYAKETGTVCVQKDACTVVTDGKDDIYLNLSGNSGMATAGSGDVLSGILAAVLCMYLKTEEQPPMVLKAALGVYLHGLCGDLAAAEKGKRSMLAGDIIEALPQALAIGEEESKL